MLRNEKIISLAEAYKKMKEGELKGDQKELDLDDDGDIDGSDLKNLRKGKKDKDIGKDKVVINPKDDVEEGSCSSKMKKEGSCSSKMKKESVDLDEAVGYNKQAYKLAIAISNCVASASPALKKRVLEAEAALNAFDNGKTYDKVYASSDFAGTIMDECAAAAGGVQGGVKEEFEEEDLEEAVGTKTAYKIQELLGRLNVLLKPTSVMGKELISTRGAGFKKDLETALNHVKAIRDIVSDIEVELSMNEGKIDDLRDKMRAKKELSRGLQTESTIDESKTEKAYDKSRFGMGDSRSEQEIRDQIKNLDDKTLKIWAKDIKKSFFNSKVRKLQNQLVAQELKRRGLQTESKDDLDEATKQDPNASDKEVLEPKVEGEKKFKLKHLIKKISDPGSSESK